MGILVLLVFWVPPMLLSGSLGRRAVRSVESLTGPAFASVLALVAWWFVLVGVVEGTADVVANLMDGLYRNAAILGIVLLGWFGAMAKVWGRARRRDELYQTVTSLFGWALVLSLPLTLFILIASVI